MKKTELRIWRFENEVKQYELANMLECSNVYLSMVETGRLEPSKRIQDNIKKVTGIEIK